MEAAPDNWSGGVDPTRAWSDAAFQNQGTSGASDSAIGSGYRNTQAIINQGNSSTTTCAATLAASYHGGGLTDWFLPSIDELTTLHTATAFAGVYELTDYYWSSTETGTIGAMVLRHEPYDVDSLSKFYVISVRPVRAF